jgi:hypothetical protein
MDNCYNVIHERMQAKFCGHDFSSMDGFQLTNFTSFQSNRTFLGKSSLRNLNFRCFSHILFLQHFCFEKLVRSAEINCSMSNTCSFLENLHTDGSEVVSLTRRPAALYHTEKFLVKSKKKTKAIRITGLGGLECCEMLRVPHCLDNRLIDGGKYVILTHPPHFTPQNIIIWMFLVLISVRSWVNPRA